MGRFNKWFLIFISTFMLTVFIIVAFNFVVDPFGTFGDHFLKMYDYDFYKNGRIAKITYLDKKFKDFDSYLVGGSKTGIFKPEMVEKYYPGTKFYNLNTIGGRLFDYEKIIQYIVKNYKVKNIVLQISQLEASKPDTSDGVTGMLHGKLVSDFTIPFYSKVLFQNPNYSIDKVSSILTQDKEILRRRRFYNVKTGAYNYEEVEQIIKDDPVTFFSNKKNFPGKEPRITKLAFDYNLEIIKRIVDYCRIHKVSLLLITAPTFKNEMVSYPKDEWINFMIRLANITEYWNFSGFNSISNEQRNFYNNDHYRLNIAEMMLARIFNDHTVSIPNDFGSHITVANASNEIKKTVD